MLFRKSGAFVSALHPFRLLGQQHLKPLPGYNDNAGASAIAKKQPAVWFAPEPVKEGVLIDCLL